ncbi:common plant regulatory factor 1-like [Oryza brachyantha]|uniref:common plant regulatory factor 1-like n=1 Tax=Oryza brachyantha TaxID=4533 RepID=UPI001ADB6C0C|nr:common plant regulatory factor 1-like [Oryza brachyantha]
MGNDEAVVTQKMGKAPSPPKDHPALGPYLDWSNMQAYYGPGILPPTFVGPGIVPGHTTPFIWGPQPLVPSAFGKPYATIYPPGGGFSHPFMPLMVNPLSMEPAKSVNSKENCSNKKLKEIDGAAISTGSGNSEKTSGDYSLEGSSDGNNQKASGTPKKRSIDDRPKSDDKKAIHVSPGVETGGALTPNDRPSERAALPNLCIPVTAIKPDVSAASDFRVIATPVTEVPTKDDKESKRERRKQSNRESARRSRLRKQAETDELARKVELLTVENRSLRREISRLAESSKKLRLENSALMEKLTETGPDEAQEVPPVKNKKARSARGVENFLSMKDNTNTSRSSGHMEQATPKLRQMEQATPKLRQLLGTRLATDAVAAR